MTDLDPRQRYTTGGPRLPDLRLPAAPAGSPMPLVPPGGRRVPIVVAVEGDGCAACIDWLRRLAEVRDEIASWDGYVLVVVPGGIETAQAVAEAIGSAFPVLADEERKLARAMEIDRSAVVIADPWGEIRHRQDAGAEHALPEPAEIVDWAKFISIQCPECEAEAL